MSCSWSSDRSESLPGRREQDLGPLGEPQVLSTAGSRSSLSAAQPPMWSAWSAVANGTGPSCCWTDINEVQRLNEANKR